MDKGFRLLVLALIRIYQIALSPLLAALGGRCRFFPSCSEYAAKSVVKFGVWRGGMQAGRRLLRCHPRHPGGLDLP